MAKLKPKRESDRAPSVGSSSRGPKLKFRREVDREPPVGSSGRRGPKLSNHKSRNDGGTISVGKLSSPRDTSKESFRRPSKDRGMISVGKVKLSKYTSKESPRRSTRYGEVLSSLKTVKKKTRYETASYSKEGSQEDSLKSKKRVTRIDPHDSLKVKDRKAPSSIKPFQKKTKYDTATDSKENQLEDRPKRKKRVIRIDPHDISNKRLDDSTTLPSGVAETKQLGVEQKKKTLNESELSQNAQFRAIKPTPSILSFVEDNLLGRRRSIELKRAGYNIDLSSPLDNIPFSTSSVRERIEETVFRNKLNFFAAAKVSSSFPPPDAPEIAFAGRSNVGKSSLLNALTRQWGVVRTSDKPGLTQTINFFQLGPKLRLVDLPGYGFAYAKEEVKDAWEELVKEYVSSRDGLKQVCLLIDTKWGMKPRDQELINIMERSQTKYQVVLTKTDTVFPIDVARRAWQIEETLKANRSIVHPVMMVSARSGAGIRSLRTALSKIARFAKI